MPRPSSILNCLFALITTCFPAGAHAVNLDDFIDFSLRDANNQVVLPGRLYVPPEALSSNAAPRPLIMNLPGSGGNGTDNLAQLPLVSNFMLAEAKVRGAFLYAPQTASSWSTTMVTDQVMTMIDRAIGSMNADAHRLYIFGYSLGSFGTWTMLSRYEGRFAAAVPISGGSPAADFVPARLVDTPVFALQARDDDAAPAATTRGLISSILAAAGQPAPIYPASSDAKDFMISNPNFPLNVSLTAQAHQFGNVTDYFLSDSQMDFMYFERATGGHSSVLSAVNSPLVYDWMFAHSTAVPEPCSALSAAVHVFIFLPIFRIRSRCNAKRHDNSATLLRATIATDDS